MSYTLDSFGPDVDYGWSPLVASTIWLTDNDTEGADCPELPDRGGCTPLDWAVECQAREVEQILRAHGATKMEFSGEDWENM